MGEVLQLSAHPSLKAGEVHGMVPFVCSDCCYGMIGDRFTVGPDGKPVPPEQREAALAKARAWDGKSFVIAGPDGPQCPHEGHDYALAQKAGVGYVGKDKMQSLDALLEDPAVREALLKKLGVKP